MTRKIEVVLLGFDIITNNYDVTFTSVAQMTVYKVKLLTRIFF